MPCPQSFHFPARIDLAAVKTRQQAAWSTGNYAVVGTTLQIVGENLCEALDLRPAARVLDVAAGNGNATLRGAPLVRGDLHRLRVLAARVGRAARAGRRPHDPSSRKPTPRTCRSPTRRSTR
jgi:hypothetical protein